MVIIDNQGNVKRVELTLTATEALLVSAAVRRFAHKAEHTSDQNLAYEILEKLYKPTKVI